MLGRFCEPPFDQCQDADDPAEEQHWVEYLDLELVEEAGYLPAEANWLLQPGGLELAEEPLALVEGLEVCLAELHPQFQKLLLFAVHCRSPQEQ